MKCKQLQELINTNFTDKDIMITITYQDQPDEQKAKRDILNYLHRLKLYRKVQGLPGLKYISVTEFTKPQNRHAFIHHHVIVSGISPEEANQFWKKGRLNICTLKSDNNGYQNLARYLTKGFYKWTKSKNLKQPKATKKI